MRTKRSPDSRFKPSLFNPATRGITINTDASFCPDTGAGGWAAYIVCDQFKIQRSGMLEGILGSSLEAEIKAIGNALVILLMDKELPEFHFVYVNTDCTNAIRDISSGSTPLGLTVKNYWDRVNVRTKSNVQEFRHVKAHTNKANARSYVNDWCDKEAKKQMQLRRAELRKK